MNTTNECQKPKFNINSENLGQNTERKYSYIYTFDIKYEILSPIIKDIQMISQLIKLVKINQLSDLIFISGNNSYTKDSRFYFNYRYIIDFYLKVIDFDENKNFIKIKYNIYKTKPISKNFFFNLSLSKADEYSSKLELEIILIDESEITEKILNIIYGEFKYNFLYLSQAIKENKQNSFFYNSVVIKHEFYILSQIVQNIKLIEYIINGKFEKINNNIKEELNSSESNNNYINNNKDKLIHLNDIYRVVLKKYKEVKDWLSINNISFKIEILRVREDKLNIQLKILTKNDNEKKEKNESDNVYNLITVHIRKITNNSSFIIIKSVWDFDLPENVILEAKKIIKKCLEKIEKLCETGKNKYNF